MRGELAGGFEPVEGTPLEWLETGVPVAGSVVVLIETCWQLAIVAIARTAIRTNVSRIIRKDSR